MRNIYLIMCAIVTYVTCQNPCPTMLSVNITEGILNASDSSMTADGLVYRKNDYYQVNETIWGCICHVKHCIRKCCGPDQKMVGRKCTATNGPQTQLQLHIGTQPVDRQLTSDHHLIYHRKCLQKKRMMKLIPDLPTEAFYLQVNGTLLRPKGMHAKLVGAADYCVEVFNVEGDVAGSDPESNQFAALVCTDFNQNDSDIVHHMEACAYDSKLNRSLDNSAKCDCDTKKCIRKCCGPNEKMVDSNCVHLDEQSNFTWVLHLYNETKPLEIAGDFQLIHSNFCENGRVRLNPDFEDPSGGDNFYLQPDGSLYLPNLDPELLYYPPDRYCLDLFDNDNVFSALLCFPEDENDQIGIQYKTGMIISMPFLLATFIAYALLPNKNLHMKALMFYVISLMFGYLLLVIVQLSDHRFSYESCAVIGYICLFFFILSFFWMNVICIDIWFTFSGLRGFGQGRGGERKRFLLYCIYAWGMSILHILVVFGITQLSSPSDWYNSGIGDGQCFLKRTYPELLYLYGPMAILITINLTLYAITAIKIRNIKKETSVLTKEDSKRHSYEDDKQTFNLYLKLLFAMGVNWIMEVISWAVDWGVGSDKVPSWVWYLTDFCNAIYGVFIFFIFVFKRSIWKLLKRCYYSFIGKPYLAHSMTQNPTRVTSYSTNTSSVHDHHPNNAGRGRHSESAILTSEA